MDTKKWEKEFDAWSETALTNFTSDGDGEEYNNYLSEASCYKELKRHIENLLTQVRQEERERVVEIIEECGHQQDDDTIWCNMDELIKRINATLPTEGEKPKCSCDGVTSACSDCPPKPSV